MESGIKISSVIAAVINFAFLGVILIFVKNVIKNWGNSRNQLAKQTKSIEKKLDKVIDMLEGRKIKY